MIKPLSRRFASRHFASIWILSIILALSVSSCSEKQATGAAVTQPEIKIGAILFLSNNELANVGNSFREGMELASDEINAQGGILGRPLRILFEDDQLNQAKTVNAAHKLIDVDKVNAGLVGAINTVKAAAPVFNEAKTPIIMVWDDKAHGIGLENLPYLFSAGFSTKEAGFALARYAREQQNLSRIAVVYQPDEWEELITRSFISRFQELGGTIILDERMDLGETDFKTIMLKTKDAQAIYAPLIANQDVFFRRARELGYTGVLLSGDTVNEQIIKNAGGSAEGVIFTQTWEPESSLNLDLKRQYEKKYGKKPEMSVFVGLGYDDVRLIAQAIKKAGSSDPEKIKEALFTVKDFEGAGGSISINDFGSSTKVERVFFVKDGAIVPVSI